MVWKLLKKKYNEDYQMNMNDLTWNEAKPLAQSKEKTAVDFKSWKAAQDFYRFAQ